MINILKLLKVDFVERTKKGDKKMNYIGSKNRLSKELVPIIQSYIDNMPNCNGYLEPFVGGRMLLIKLNVKINMEVM